MKQSKASTSYYRVVKAFFVYDKREESLYDQYVQEIEEEEAEAQRAVAAPLTPSDISQQPPLPLPAAVRINETVHTEETPASETHNNQNNNNHGLTLDIPLQRHPSKTNSAHQLSEEDHDIGRDRLRSENANVGNNDNKSPLIMDKRVRLESFDAMFGATVNSNELSPQLGQPKRSIEAMKSPFLDSAKSKSASVESLQDVGEKTDEMLFESGSKIFKEPNSPSQDGSGAQKTLEEQALPKSSKVGVGRSQTPNRTGVPAVALNSKAALNQIEEVEENLDHD